MNTNIEVLRGLRERLVRINNDTDGDNHINESCDALDELDAALAALSEQPEAHPDDAAVDAFAAAMKAKLAEARAKGRGGWQDKADCPHQRLSDMLRAHVEKGDPRDVANFACFLWNRGEGILPAEQPEAQAGVDRKRFEQAPCYLCGYNGPGYYQPSQHPCAANYHAPPPSAVPEVVVSRQIITPTCRKNRGGWGAFWEAFDRVRKAYLHYVEAPQNANVEWHLTLTRVEVAAAPEPKE